MALNKEVDIDVPRPSKVKGSAPLYKEATKECVLYKDVRRKRKSTGVETRLVSRTLSFNQEIEVKPEVDAGKLWG